MSDLPTLIAEGDPADWLPPVREDTVHIGGPLPIVTEEEFDWHRGHQAFTRPLWVGDRVVLAEPLNNPLNHPQSLPFATATVKEIDPWSYMDRDDHGYHITVTDVQPLE